jgi:hypothetical protein
MSINKRKPEGPPKKGKDLKLVFARLLQVLDHCEGGWVKKGNPHSYTYLESSSTLFRGRPLWFGGVRLGKNYVSFHLMPVYARPTLLKGISPQLKKRMQGKACFNFTSVDEELMGELEKLTAAGAATFNSAKFLRQMNNAWRPAK